MDLDVSEFLLIVGFCAILVSAVAGGAELLTTSRENSECERANNVFACERVSVPVEMIQ